MFRKITFLLCLFAPITALADSNIEQALNERLVAWSTLALALITAFLAFFTYRLWLANKKLIENAADTTIRQLRAYISADIRNSVDKEGSPILDNWTVEIINRGQTPAHQMQFWGCIGLDEFPKKDAFEVPPLSERMITKSQLHPGEVCNLVLARPPYNPIEIAAIQSGKYATYLYGKIEYKNTFNKECWTTFCFYMDIEGRRINKWAHFSTLNDMDHDGNAPPY